MKKFVGFLLPVVLVLSGSVGMVVSGFAATTSYSQADYDLAYEKAGEFQYRNAAVKGISDTLESQLTNWKYWKFVPYALLQARGEVYEVRGQPWQEDLTEYSSYGSRNILDVLVIAVDDPYTNMSACRNIATSGSYSYDTFSRLVKCAGENGGNSASSYLNTHYKGLYRDADIVLQMSENTIKRYAPDLLPWEDVRDASVGEMINQLSNSAYVQTYGLDFYDRDNSIIAGWSSLAWRGQGKNSIFSSDFDVDLKGTMSETDREDFAVLYAHAKAINPDFNFDFDNYIEKSDPTPDPVPDPDQPPNTPDIPTRPSGGNTNSVNNANKVTAPNTGSLAKFKGASTNNAGFILSAVATTAGLIGMILVVKSYLFSPLKRR